MASGGAQSVKSLREKGDAHVERGETDDAVRCYQQCTQLFIVQRAADPAIVEDFVAAAGSLCLALHTLGHLNLCFSTARDVLTTYPVIPAAFGAMGMCIMDRIREQRERLTESRAVAASSGSKARTVAPPLISATADLHARYVAVMDGNVFCSAEEAHTILCRAVLLSEGALQVSLGPYIEQAVKLITEQLLTAGPTFERERGPRVLVDVAPAVTELPREAPCFLSALSPAPAQSTVRVMDAVSRTEVQPTPEEAAEIQKSAAAALAEAQNGSVEDAAAAQTPAPPPVDFALSGRPVAVHVCHGKGSGKVAGAIPRNVALVRNVTGPFAVANWLPHNRRAGNSTAVVSTTQPSSRYIDPTAADMDAVIAALQSAESTPLPETCCVACGKDVRRAAALVGCTVCHSVNYCSGSCEAAYKGRHEMHECALLVALREISSEAASGAAAGGAAGGSKKPSLKPPRRIPGRPTFSTSGSNGSSPTAPELNGKEENGTSLVATTATDCDTPGSAWKLDALYARVLPLCISVYSGIKDRAPGWEEVVAQLERGIDRTVLSAMPPPLMQALEKLSSRLSEQDLPVPSLGNAKFMRYLFFLVRLYTTPSPDQESSLFFTERMELRHSCEPNCAWSDVLKVIFTSRLIYPGEELTLAVDSAFPQHWPWQIRRKWLLREHGFVCKCTRCMRESNQLNTTRGDLSDDIIEKLLTGDLLRRVAIEAAPENEPVVVELNDDEAEPEKKPTSSVGAEQQRNNMMLKLHPTQYFHPRVQAATRDALAFPNFAAAQERLEKLMAEVSQHLLPTHYLFEDLRHALCQISLLQGKSSIAIQHGRGSLLFYESFWAGCIPAKTRVLRAMPAVFDCMPRRNVRRQMRRRPHADGTAAEQPATPTRDYSKGTVVDQYYGSYEAWYQ